MKRSFAIAIAFLQYTCPAYAGYFRSSAKKNILFFILISCVHSYALSQPLNNAQQLAKKNGHAQLLMDKKLFLIPGVETGNSSAPGSLAKIND